MQAVIMAAGRGTRLGLLTADQPKALVKIGDQPILGRTLEALAPLAEEIIIVVGYRGEKIKECFGANFKRIPLVYVKQKVLAGTAKALWEARAYLQPGKFLVLNGDDLYFQEELKAISAENLGLGLTSCRPLGKNYETVQLDAEGLIKDWRKVNFSELNQEMLMINGAYGLDERIFNFSPVAIGGGEYGLPQTILAMSKIYPVRGVIMKRWVPINRPEDIVAAENFLKQNSFL